MKLTEHQQDRLNTCLEQLRIRDRMLILGSAGVGKTFMVNELVKQLLPTLNENQWVYCTAPTNKAVSVLKSKIDAKGRIAFLSTHKALKMQRLINEDDGEFYFEPVYKEEYPPLFRVGVLIVDEASMINKNLLTYIEIWSKVNNTKVIFLMDDKQLPPVNELEMPVLTQNYPSVKLTEIIRQKNGNPIINLSLNLHLVNYPRDNMIKVPNGNGKLIPTGYVFTDSSDYNKIIERLVLSNGTDLYKYIGYTNEEVNKMNSIIRYNIYGNNPSKIEIGETMIFDAPYQREYNTNEEITIKNKDIREHTYSFLSDEDKFEVTIKYYLANFQEFQGITLSGIKIIHEDSEQDFNKTRQKIKQAIKENKMSWQDYYFFTEQFAQLKYNHALTCHKS